MTGSKKGQFNLQLIVDPRLDFSCRSGFKRMDSTSRSQMRGKYKVNLQLFLRWFTTLYFTLQKGRTIKTRAYKPAD
uniref:Uncharacterized protein n=1 Tax=Utricularia reniformis TaxID=192314 RepID=A0A1Y0B4X6_9LAMI|nr:hypothetical protein AEK19_MT2274 [Utricularia reniformis]ART32419.1 hypothetical protein AEK19_MT2274 [Utricularia reniformis]